MNSIETGGNRVCIAAPREHAKTTIMTAYMIRGILYNLEPYQTIYAATATKAEQILGNISYELKNNPRIVREFRSEIQMQRDSLMDQEFKHSEPVRQLADWYIGQSAQRLRY